MRKGLKDIHLIRSEYDALLLLQTHDEVGFCRGFHPADWKDYESLVRKGLVEKITKRKGEQGAGSCRQGAVIYRVNEKGRKVEVPIPSVSFMLHPGGIVRRIDTPESVRSEALLERAVEEESRRGKRKTRR